MQFSDILGQEYIKNHLIKSAAEGRIPHAQLFVGPEGCGALATALATHNLFYATIRTVLTRMVMKLVI